MEFKRKECWCCYNYRAYYTKKFCHFENQNCGLCLVCNEIITDKHYSCEKWRFNGIRRRIRKSVSLKALYNSLDNLLEIRQILVEEIDENKKNPIE